MDEAIKALLQPKSIAIVGASDNLMSIGGRPIRYLQAHGYKGKVYPINPKYEQIAGLKCYPSLLEVPDEIDLVLLAVSSRLVFDILDQCAQKRAKSAVVFSSGFAEVGGQGVANQARLKEFADRTGIRLCGPNCMGLFNPRHGVVASFSNAGEAEALLPGTIGVISQSGALAGSIFDKARSKAIGVSYLVSSGNEADLETAEYMEFMVEDPDTTVIAAFVESLKDPLRFLRVAEKAVERRKPIVIFKSGRSDVGRRAAASHTGALAGSDAVYDAVFRQKGVIRANDLDDLVEIASYFAKNRLPDGDRVGILSISGGAGVIVADECTARGIPLPEPAAATKEKLSTIVPDFGSISNPADMTAQGYNERDLLYRMLYVYAQDPNFDTILALVTMVAGDMAAEYAEQVVNGFAVTDKPVATFWAGGDLSTPGFKVIQNSRVPLFRRIDTMVNAVNASIWYKRYLERHDVALGATAGKVQPATNVASDILRGKRGALTEYESKSVLAQYGIPITREHLATSQAEALEYARALGYPVVLKVMSPQIAHKTEAGAVAVGIQDEAGLIVAYNSVLENARRYQPDAQISGVLVQEMVRDGLEVIVGVSKDPQFGPVVMFGLGGVFVEVLKDVALRLAPLSERDAVEMVRETKGFKLLQGYRGKPAADVDALVDVLLKMSALAVDLSDQVEEIDINPLVLLEKGKGAMAVDALVVCRR